MPDTQAMDYPASLSASCPASLEHAIIQGIVPVKLDGLARIVVSVMQRFLIAERMRVARQLFFLRAKPPFVLAMLAIQGTPM